jgi:hypothetical protein
LKLAIYIFSVSGVSRLKSSQTYLKFPTTASGIERACATAGQKPQTSPVAL